jgi:hypothetical protein
MERFNCTLVDMLCTASEGGKYIEGWEEYVPMLQFVYNTAWQASVGETPYFLMFGRTPATPVDLPIEHKEWKDLLDKARECAVQALSKVQDSQRRLYDRKRKEPRLAVGDVVWLREG